MFFSTLLTCAGLVHLGIAGYTLEDDYSASHFFSMFNFKTENDPTNGYVNFLDQADAQSQGLINTNNGQVYIGVDYTNVASGRGRSSVRVESIKQYTHALVVLDLAHMPGGICGTWPAFWMYGPSWPNSGEIDIIEGVNDQPTDSMTLHTTGACSVVNNPSTFSGSMLDEVCSPNQGCTVSSNTAASYGKGFNSNGGGVYAMEWTSSGISIWFWPQGQAPGDALGAAPNPAGWGKPVSYFTGCDIDEYFLNHWLVFDNTFCGAWAGSVWGGSCATANGNSCNAFVQNNPGAFKDAYWLINSLKVYQNNGTPAPAPAPAPPPPPPTTTATPVPSPVSPSQVTVTALNGDEFGVGSNGIPERRKRSHMRHVARHLRHAGALS